MNVEVPLNADIRRDSTITSIYELIAIIRCSLFLPGLLPRYHMKKPRMTIVTPTVPPMMANIAPNDSPDSPLDGDDPRDSGDPKVALLDAKKDVEALGSSTDVEDPEGEVRVEIDAVELDADCVVAKAEEVDSGGRLTTPIAETSDRSCDCEPKYSRNS